MLFPICSVFGRIQGRQESWKHCGPEQMLVTISSRKYSEGVRASTVVVGALVFNRFENRQIRNTVSDCFSEAYSFFFFFSFLHCVKDICTDRIKLWHIWVLGHTTFKAAMKSITFKPLSEIRFMWMALLICLCNSVQPFKHRSALVSCSSWPHSEMPMIVVDRATVRCDVCACVRGEAAEFHSLGLFCYTT